MVNPLSNLVLDSWYKVLMVVGMFVFLLTAAGVLSVLPAVPSLLISLGIFLFGLGEWVNHPLQTGLLSATAFHPAGIVTSYPRRFSVAGCIFDLIGLGLLGAGVYRLF